MPRGSWGGLGWRGKEPLSTLAQLPILLYSPCHRPTEPLEPAVLCLRTEQI